MKREDFFGKLSKELADFTILDVDVPSPFGWDLRKSAAENCRTGSARPSSRGTYRAERDKRLGITLKPVSGTQEDIRMRFVHEAMSVVVGLCGFALGMPDEEALSEAIRLAGTTPKELNEFVREWITDSEMSCLGAPSLQPTAILLVYALSSAMVEGAVAPGGGRKRKNRAKDAVTSRDRLLACADYLREQGCLRLMDLGLLEKGWGAPERWQDYEEFFLFFTLLACRRTIAVQELKDLRKRMEDEGNRLLRRGEKMMQEEIRNSAPVLRPLAPVRAYPDMRDGVSDVPQQLKAVKERMTEALDALERYRQAVSDRCGETLNQATLQEVEYMKGEFGCDIAESAFMALVSGDELYRLDVADFVFTQLGAILGMPCDFINMPELEDEEEWDESCHPADNGKLAQPILRDTDVIAYDLDSGEGRQKKDLGNRKDILLPLKLSSVIAGYAGRYLPDELYIRKSHLKAFRRLGYSERKARDYAIVVGVLRMIQEEEKYHRWQFPEAAEPNPPAESLPVESSVPDAVKELKHERDEAVRNRKAAERESQSLRHELAEASRRQAELMKKLGRMQEELKRREEWIEVYEKTVSEEEDDGAESTEEERFPFTTPLRVVLYGGFHSFHQDVEKLIPGIRIVSGSAHLDLAVFRSADIIFLQINKTGHSNYWSVVDTAKNLEIPFYHLNYAGPKRCAMEMVKQIQKLEKKKKKS